MTVEKIEKPSNVLPFRAKGSAVEKIANAVEVKNATDEGAELWLTGEVGWDIYAPAVIDQLKAMDGEGKKITIYLSSPGGDVFEGYQIGNFIRSMKAEVTVVVQPLAASIASFIAVCADRVVMPANSMLMIHNAWAGVVGEAEELENMATLLRKLNAQLVASYGSKRTATLGSNDGENFADLMAATSWLTPEEAQALGLCDEIMGAVKAAASVRDDMLDHLEVPSEIAAALKASADGSEGASEGSEGSEGQADGKDAAAPSDPEEADDAAAGDASPQEGADADAGTVSEEGDAGQEDATQIAGATEVEKPEGEAGATAQDTPALSDRDQADIRAACAVFNMSDKADGFIAARASFEDVRAVLFRLRAEADQAQDTNTRIASAAPSESRTAAPSIHSVKATALAAVRGKRKS